MCRKWLLDNRSVSNLEIVFPVTGHSYLPSDRVFGQIEKLIKRQENIICPNDYTDIIKKFAKVLKVGEHCTVYDWRKKSGEIIKPPGQWPFKFIECKRFFLKRSKKVGNVLVQGEAFYRSKLGKFISIVKVNKSVSMLQPNQIARGVKPKAAKIQDVKTLLDKHNGPDWTDMPELNYFDSIIRASANVEPDEDDNNDVAEDFCSEHPVEEIQLRI